MVPQSRKRTTSPRKRPTTRFAPQIVCLEDRSVPATFYVDPNAFLQGNGLYTFNLGLAGEKTDLTLGADIFFDFNTGLAMANGTAGPDTLRLANGDIVIDNSLGTVDVTDALTIAGSGSGATRIVPNSNTVDEFGPDAAVLRATGVELNINQVTLDGNAPLLQVGQFVRWQGGATGTVDRTSSLYTVFTPVGFNSGAAFVATDAGTVVNVMNSQIDAPGAVGIGYQLGATGKVMGNTFAGGGKGDFIIYGVQITEGSTNVLISGNTFTNFQGVSGGVNSAGVLITAYDAFADTFPAPTNANIIGNTFTSNITGIIIGVPDTAANLDSNANAVIRHNNISGNDTAIVTDVVAGTTVDALMNWWGNATGPFAAGNLTAAGNNLTSPANPVGINTLWRNVAINPNAAVLNGPTPVIAAASELAYRDALPKPTVTITPVTASPTNASPAKFKIEFSQPVSEFTLADITVTQGALGGTVALTDSANAAVTGATRDTVFFVTVTGMNGDDTISVNVPASGVAGGLPTIRTDLFGGTQAAGAPGEVDFDNVAPVITLSSPNGALPITATTSTSGFVVSFSEPVTGFTAADLVLSGIGATGATPTVTPVGTDGTTYNVTLTGLTKRGPINVAIGASAATDGAGNGNAALASTATINVVPPFSRGFAVGGDVGNSQPYFGVDENLATRTGTTPFGSTFTGGVRVATADFNGDGTLDVLVGSGEDVRAEIKLYDGATTKLLGKMNVFEDSYTRGVFVAVGDVNGDGTPDIVVTPDVGGSSRTSVFDGKTFVSSSGAAATTIANFFALADDTQFRGGGRTAVADFNGDGFADVVFAAGFTGGPRIATFAGKTIGASPTPVKLWNDIFGFTGTDIQDLRNGTYVAAGDVNGDGTPDLIVGAGLGGAARVQAFSGSKLLANTTTTVANFFAGNVNNPVTGRGGARVDATDLDGDGRAEIIVGGGKTGGSTVGIFNGTNPNLIAGGSGILAPNQTIDVFGGFADGVFVG
jgi:hypothetical protein